MTLSVAVIGNCQVGSMARCVRALLPEAAVKPISLMSAVRESRAEAMAKVAERCDLIFTQEFETAGLGPLTTTALAAVRPDLIRYPRIVFTGFHPDINYIFDGPRAVTSPMGDYHSEILMGAFLSGLPLERALRLFRPLTYQRLGYFKEYARCLRRLVRDGEALGFDLAPLAETWRADGAFMHTINHPKIRVMASLARLALARAGLAVAEIDPDQIEDGLAAGPRWPVYPEIAERLEVAGGLDFVTANASGGEVIDLAAFAAGSYERYGELSSEVLGARLRSATLEVIAGIA